MLGGKFWGCLFRLTQLHGKNAILLRWLARVSRHLADITLVQGQPAMNGSKTQDMACIYGIVNDGICNEE